MVSVVCDGKTKYGEKKQTTVCDQKWNTISFLESVLQLHTFYRFFQHPLTHGRVFCIVFASTDSLKVFVACVERYQVQKKRIETAIQQSEEKRKENRKKTDFRIPASSYSVMSLSATARLTNTLPHSSHNLWS